MKNKTTTNDNEQPIAPATPQKPTFDEWYDARFEDDDGETGGHISTKLIRRWVYDEIFDKKE